jgi:mannose-6-phosphate isomerase
MGPLEFQPIFKRIRWGGRRLATVLGKAIGPESDYAESWEISDHGADQSIVSTGPLAGWTLRRLIDERSAELLGRHAGLKQFPLLLKFLDASDRLSVQVHPNDEQARRYDPQERGKTEAWVILDALPGSCVYTGLNPGVTRATLEAALADRTVERCLHRVVVRAGDCLFIPAGTVHAIGEGVLLAEVQQSSDLTFRLFDWNRTGSDGKPRPLHIEQALDCINFLQGPVGPQTPLGTREGAATIEQLVECQYFTIRRITTETPFTLSNDDRCRLWMILAGEGTLQADTGEMPIKRGTTVMIPASVCEAKIVPRTPVVLLDVFWH